MYIYIEQHEAMIAELSAKLRIAEEHLHATKKGEHILMSVHCCAIVTLHVHIICTAGFCIWVCQFAVCTYICMYYLLTKKQAVYLLLANFLLSIICFLFFEFKSLQCGLLHPASCTARAIHAFQKNTCTWAPLAPKYFLLSFKQLVWKPTAPAIDIGRGDGGEGAEVLEHPQDFSGNPEGRAFQ